MGLFSSARKTFGNPPEPSFAVVRIPAADVQPGMTVTAIAAGTREVDELWPGEDGNWPTVAYAEYWERGEDDEPTVYIVLDDDPHGCYPVYPETLISVAAEAEVAVEPWSGH